MKKSCFESVCGKRSTDALEWACYSVNDVRMRPEKLDLSWKRKSSERKVMQSSKSGNPVERTPRYRIQHQRSDGNSLHYELQHDESDANILSCSL